ncbi:MAG: GNAT family N-acetyltransferase [Thermoguttaceae bacterium]|jgi:N-acetylglutamate synthase-like GNAT family acetyltransferase
MDDLDTSGNIGIIEHHPEPFQEGYDTEIGESMYAGDEFLPSSGSRTAAVTDRVCRRTDARPSQANRSAHPQDCVWAVTIDNRVVGVVSILHEGQHVARINTFRIHPDWQHTAALTKLVDRVHQYCWNQGYLKVTLEEGAAPAMVRKMLEHRGFHLVRCQNVVGKPRLDYYIDLYFSPHHEDPQPNKDIRSHAGR